MKESSRYFQLTQDILLEYKYANIEAERTSGDHSLGFEGTLFTGEILDINKFPTTRDITNINGNENCLGMMSNGYNDQNYIFGLYDESKVNNGKVDYRTYRTNNWYGNLVVPINKTETKYINTNIHYDEDEEKYIGANDYNTKLTSTGNLDINAGSWEKDEYTDIVFDTITLHFLGGKYMNSFEGFILNTYVYDKKKTKINLSSILLKPSDTLFLHSNPLMVADKIYTSFIQFRIPSVNYISTYWDGFNYNNLDIPTGQFRPGEKLLKAISTYDQSDNKGFGLQDNAPIYFSVKGIKNSYTKDGDRYYNVEEIANVAIPNKDTYNKISVDIREAKDGCEYFEIRTVVNDGKNGSKSFSDYLYELDDNFSVVHEIHLTEYYLDEDQFGKPLVRSRVTHREYFASGVDFNEYGELNDDNLFDQPILYRPVLLTNNTWYFTITDTLRIINNTDETTIVKTGSLSYGKEKSQNVHRYGKKMQPIVDLNTQIIQANVYNKRQDRELDSVKLVASNTGFVGANAASTSGQGGAGAYVGAYDENGNYIGGSDEMVRMLGGKTNKLVSHQYNITSFIEASNIAISVSTVQIEP